MDYIEDFRETIKCVSTVLGRPIDLAEVEIIDRGCPHIPQKLKQGMMGVYTFSYHDRFLKIGKVGSKSNARFLSQHYLPNSAKSTLAASILADKDMEYLGLTADTVGLWIKENCRRIDLLINANLDVFTLELIEASLHYKYQPKYEGFSSQR